MKAAPREVIIDGHKVLDLTSLCQLFDPYQPSSYLKAGAATRHQVAGDLLSLHGTTLLCGLQQCKVDVFKLHISDYLLKLHSSDFSPKAGTHPITLCFILILLVYLGIYPGEFTAIIHPGQPTVRPKLKLMFFPPKTVYLRGAFADLLSSTQGKLRQN